MILGKRRKIGKKAKELEVGERLKLTEKIEDKDLLLYLGLTNDANPLYVQHDYASTTSYEKPLVPSIMLTGIISSAISKYLPGPGAHIVEQHLTFPKPVYHYATIEFSFQIIKVVEERNRIFVEVHATDEQGDLVIEGTVVVAPPQAKDALATSFTRVKNM